MAKGNKKSQEPSFKLLTNTKFQQCTKKITRKSPETSFVDAVKVFLHNESSPEALSALWQHTLALSQSGSGSTSTEHIFQQEKEEELAEGRKAGFQKGKKASAKGQDLVRREG
ncbi:hypothetical protein Moror_15092 [Moniliophthora roreri MCA 2997]|uniref:Uncharacterized protein n=1 Tax=Moniliophthora roreri (strain MCA 2997) TaxID=1381753 RepID=V2WRU3_MONRO|nr:hypothetical protein Moror_15092 [Moniliophthora roreri MCA 2997]